MDDLGKNLGPRDKLISVITHDLMNPLGAILAYSELLLASELGERDQRQVEAIGRAATRIRRMLQNLSDITKLQAERFELKLARVDPALLVLEALESLRPRAALRGIEVELSGLDRLPAITADAEQLARALTVFLANAIQFSRDKGVVRITADVAPEWVSLTIADQGAGLSADDLRDFFGDPSQGAARPARGLSLLTARALVDAQGGTFAIQSRENAGTTITIAFRPADRAHPTPAGNAQSPRRPWDADARG